MFGAQRTRRTVNAQGGCSTHKAAAQRTRRTLSAQGGHSTHKAGAQRTRRTLKPQGGRWTHMWGPPTPPTSRSHSDPIGSQLRVCVLGGVGGPHLLRAGCLGYCTLMPSGDLSFLRFGEGVWSRKLGPLVARVRSLRDGAGAKNTCFSSNHGDNTPPAGIRVGAFPVLVTP